MSPSTILKVVLISLISLPICAYATPFDPGRVPADADGVGHLDMDALRKTVLHRLVAPKVIKEINSSKGSHGDEMEAKLRPLARALFSTAQGLSFWLTDRDTGAVMVQVPDAKKIQVLLDKVPHKGEVRVAGYVARKYILSKGDPDESLAAMVGNLLIMADDEASLAKAIGAASGKVQSLGAARGMPEGARERGVFFFTALNDRLLNKVKDAAQSKTLRINMTSLTVHIGEVSSEVRVRAKMVMASADEAQKIKSMTEGVLALASMSDEAAELKPFTKGLKVTTSGKAVEISVAIPAAEMVKIIESHD